MPRPKRWTILALVVATAWLSGCADTASASDDGAEPAELVEVDGRDVPNVVLTEKAAERLGIEVVALTVDGAETVVPYSAVVYDPDGAAWVYTIPEPLTYARAPIEITRIDGERVLVSTGPAAATEVVTVGTAELYGVEQGIGS